MLSANKIVEFLNQHPKAKNDFLGGRGQKWACIKP